jgi:hypothetical protein
MECGSVMSFVVLCSGPSTVHGSLTAAKQRVHDRLDAAKCQRPLLKVPTNLQILSILSFMFDKSTLARYSRHFFLSSSAI